MIVHQPKIEVKDGGVCISARVEMGQTATQFPGTLYFKFPERYADCVTDRADAFAVGLFLIASSLGEDLKIHGTVSPRLLYGMEEYQKLFMLGWPGEFKKIDIQCNRIEPLPSEEVQGAVLSTFSGGSDSFHTLWRSLPQNQPISSARVTHGLFLNGFDIPFSRSERYDGLKADYEALYERLNLKLISGVTNIRQFATGVINIDKFEAIPLISSALVLSPLVSRFYVPSTGVPSYIFPYGSSPVGDHWLSTETLEVFYHGATFSLIEKLVDLSEWEEARNRLRVCLDIHRTDNQTNCSKCYKCMRVRVVLNTLGLLGKFQTFRHPFTMADYLHWGRWLKWVGEYEVGAIHYAWKYRKSHLPMLLLGFTIGIVRSFLLKHLPDWIQKPIQKLVSPAAPPALFTYEPEIEISGEKQR